ncbi:unnamed protein product [Prorocentrum cordatum]|uniref:Uncharacterized protein n=1 Tax=Prorocentrum cordatum TaxID=2364126 RepID=A0ABN9WQM6_9DINO|nr:unnamed protein product [Polarella glacialis]
MDFVNHHDTLKDCKVFLLPFCASGLSFLKANSLYPDKFKNVIAWATTNLFQLKHMIGTMKLDASAVNPVFATKQAQYIEQGLLKANDPDVNFSVERISATMYAKDVKVPVLFCDPINDPIDNHKVDAAEIFAEFGKTLRKKPANEFHCIGTDQPPPFKTIGDNRSEGFNLKSEAGSKVLLEFFRKCADSAGKTQPVSSQCCSCC